MEYRKLLDKARKESERYQRLNETKSKYSTGKGGLMSAPLDMPEVEQSKGRYGQMAEQFMQINQARRSVAPKEEAPSGDVRPKSRGEGLGTYDIDMGGDLGATAAQVLSDFEGFRETPYWDVNAYRIGYGSDTITKADGSVVKVEKGMSVTKEDAMRDKQRRLNNEFIPKAKAATGEAWDSYHVGAQAALTSIAYNYGSIPKRIRAQAQSGDLEALARAVEGLAGDNDGINAKRRYKEAALIRGDY